MAKIVYMIIINARFLTQKITGVQRFAIELSKCLKETDIDLKWVGPKNIVNQDFVKFFDVELIGNKTGHLWEQIDLPIYLKKKGNPLLLNLCNSAPLFYKNSVSTIHDLAFLENPKWFSRKFYWYYRFLIPKVASVSRHLLTVSEFSKKELCRKLFIKEDKVTVISNSVSDSFFKEKREGEGDYILFVGSLDPRKNLLKLMEAMDYVPESVKLKVVGCGNKSFSKSNNSIRNQKIEILGYVSDEELNELYRKARAFIYPSLYEGFGIPPLEAQAMGVPILISDIPVFKENFGNSAKYCNPNDSKDMAESIIRLFFLPPKERIRLIEKGYLNVNRYSWHKSSKVLVNELLKVNGGK